MATRAMRLYLLLSWLVTSYLLISISRESLLSDVNIFNRGTETFTNRGVSELLFKQLNKLRSCPVVILRGLSHSKRKGRPMNRFEAFICLNVIWFVLRLRSLVNLINDLLLRAGDVEINPGPTPPSTPDYTKSSASNGLDQQQPSMSGNSGTALLGRTLSHQETTLPDVPINRKFSERPTSLVMPQTDPQFFPEGRKDEARIDDNGLNYLTPQEEVALQLPASPVGRREDMANSDRENDIRESRKHNTDSYTVGMGPSLPTAEDDEQAHILVPDRRNDSLRRKSLPQIQNLSKYPLVRKQQEEAALLCEGVEEQLKQTGEAPQQLTDFFIAANKLYIKGEKCPVCPTCLEHKHNNGGKQGSHVIPKCILKYYWKIHSTDKHEDYIRDFSRGEMLTPSALTYQLLCGDCETHYSVTEQYLLDIYLHVVAYPDINYIRKHEDEKSTSWLKYILANILFRGILTNIDLSRIQKESMFKEIYYLWKFCRKVEKECVPPDLKVFLLPNKPFNKVLHDFMFPFEMLVRMPLCTELVVQDDVGTFFYTKFDIFHIVLPLCEKSRVYFDTFNNGLTSEGVDLHLRWADLQKAEISRGKKSMEFKYSPESSNLKDHFPEALLGWCAALYETVVSRVYNHPQVHTLKPFLAVANRYCRAHFIGFDTKERMNMATVLKERNIVDQRASRTTSYKDQSSIEKQREKYVTIASRSSPLRRPDLKESNRLNAALAEAKEDLGGTRKELGEARDRLERVQSQEQKMKELVIAQIQDSIKDLERFKFLYKSSLRHNLLKEHPMTDTAQLKEVLTRKATHFECLSQVSKGTSVHQDYKNLCKGYRRLLSLTPPSTPTSPNPQSLKFL